MKLLRDGGRLAIVLPDTYLFSDSYGWLIKWLSQFTITHSINVPIEAFEPHCRAKTSILVLKKTPPKKGHQIIGSLCETSGADKHGKARFKFVDGLQTEDRDDEIKETGILLQTPGHTDESKLFFRFPQDEAVKRGVFVASYWWRRPYIANLEKFAKDNACELVSVGELIESGELQILDGHGSPSSHCHGKGPVPYVKVVDIKNWRVIENPKYSVPTDVADKFLKRKKLLPHDLVTPTRASRNIGLFGLIMPWQTTSVLTREIAIWRTTDVAKRIDPWLLLALLSTKVVHDQFHFLVLMQMNREDLGHRIRELLIPIPKDAMRREQWSKPIHEYFEATTLARVKYDDLSQYLDPALFVDRP
jgi:type I restriction enzyme M protein